VLKTPNRVGFLLAIVFIGIVVSAGIARVAATQDAVATNGAQTRSIKTTTSLVLVDAMAEDKKSGAPVEDLQQDDFQLRDNGKAVSISSFNRGKDHKLRPIQLWFVLLCNEELHTQMGGRRRGQVESTEQWGVSFLAGKTTELRPALEHLKPEDTLGVAHWCDDGQSEIDVPPSADHYAALAAMDQFAQRKTVVIQQDTGRDPQTEVTALINNTARTSFPEPFLAIIFLGGKQTEKSSGGKSGDVWSGFMEESSMDFGMGGAGTSGTESFGHAVQGSDYVKRLGVYLDNLHQRYEIGFEPGKEGKKPHRVSVMLTKGAKEKYPDAMLRYREVYSGADQSASSDNAKQAIDWKDLDSKMRAAVKSPTTQTDLKFIAQKMEGTPGGIEHFLVRIPQNDLTWKMLPNGDRRCVVMAVIASYSTKGQPVGVTVKELEIVQEFDRLKELKDKPVLLSLRVTVTKRAAKVRVLVRDDATGHIGTQDL
jgi:hypothetical protein